MNDIRYYKSEKDFLDALEAQFKCEVVEEIAYIKRKNPLLKESDLLKAVPEGYFDDFFLDFMDDTINQSASITDSLKEKLSRRVRGCDASPITNDYALGLFNEYKLFLNKNK